MNEVAALYDKEEIQEWSLFRQENELRRTKLERLVDRKFKGDPLIEKVKRQKLKKLSESLLEEFVASEKLERIIIRSPKQGASNRRDRDTIRYVNPELPNNFWLDDKLSLTKTETARLLSISRGTLDKWIADRGFPAEIDANSQIEGIRKSAIKNWLNSKKTSKCLSNRGFCVRNYYKFTEPRDAGNTCLELVLLNRCSNSLLDLLDRIIKKQKPKCLIEFTRFACQIAATKTKEATDLVLTDPLCAVQFVLEMRRFGRENEIERARFRTASFENSKALYFWFGLVSHEEADLKELNKFANRLSHAFKDRRKEYLACFKKLQDSGILSTGMLGTLRSLLNHMNDIDENEIPRFETTNDVVFDYTDAHSERDQYFNDAEEMVDFWNHDRNVDLSGKEAALIRQIENCDASISYYRNQKKVLENRLWELRKIGA